MKKVFTTPQGFFLLLAVLILIVGFSKDGSKLDLNYFLSFLLVDVWSVAMVSSLFFVLISINYASLSLIGKKAITGLTIAHIVLQIIALVPLIYFMVNATAGALNHAVSYADADQSQLSAVSQDAQNARDNFSKKR